MKEYKTDDLVKEISELRKRMATLREDNRKLRHELFQKSVKRRASHFSSLKDFLIDLDTKVSLSMYSEKAFSWGRQSDPLKKQDESLYFLLQEFMLENNSLRVANKELKAKALQESKTEFCISYLRYTVPRSISENSEVEKVSTYRKMSTNWSSTYRTMGCMSYLRLI